MLTKLRPRSAYDVMAALSLFIVLGGTSYAVATGSIDSREIKNSTIRGKDVKNNSLTGRDVTRLGTADIRNSSLLAKDFKAGQLPAGPQGRPGAAGQNATKLFGYISDQGAATPATVLYGPGVAAVEDDEQTGFTGLYVVTFDRSVANCVVQANAGTGDPDGNLAKFQQAFALVNMAYGSANEVEITFQRADESYADTSFLVTALCP